MTDPDQTPKPKSRKDRRLLAHEIIRDLQGQRRPYGRARQDTSLHVMTVIREDAAQAVRAVMAEHNISASGAAHHLIRLGAGLPPLLP
jgi:hypothetical protein